MSSPETAPDVFGQTSTDPKESEVLDQIIVDDEHNPRWPIIPADGLPPLSPTMSGEDKMPYSGILSERLVVPEDMYAGTPVLFASEDSLSQPSLFESRLVDPPGIQQGAFECKTETPLYESPDSLSTSLQYDPTEQESEGPSSMKGDDDVEWCRDAASSKSSSSDIEGIPGIAMDSGINELIKTPFKDEFYDSGAQKKKVQKPPTTAGITLDNLKAVFGLERPEAEKRLGLKRTTFSNLSRYYGISKWPFRTIRDATNRKEANEIALRDKNLSKEKRKKLLRQQMNLQGVINLMYSDPSQSKDSNTLAVLMNIVSSRDEGTY